jgi:hypothetical protein
VDAGPFLAERGIFFNFACFADKVGGHVYWIQHEETALDSTGEPMTCIGEFVSSPDIEIGDTGIAYIFYSPKTGETRMSPHYF